MADAFGCRYLQVIGPADAPVTDAAAAPSGRCATAPPTTASSSGIEFLPFTDIVSVHDARAIVEEAGRPNGGICVDIWHHERGADDLDAIAALPADLITVHPGQRRAQGARRPRLLHATASPTGWPRATGSSTSPGSSRPLRAAGSTVNWSPEVCSSWGWAHPDEHIARIATGMRSALVAA